MENRELLTEFPLCTLCFVIEKKKSLLLTSHKAYWRSLNLENPVVKIFRLLVQNASLEERVPLCPGVTCVICHQ